MNQSLPDFVRRLQLAISSGVLAKTENLYATEDLPEILGIDSLDFVELIMAIEKKYGTKLKIVGDLLVRLDQLILD